MILLYYSNKFYDLNMIKTGSFCKNLQLCNFVFNNSSSVFFYAYLQSTFS